MLTEIEIEKNKNDIIELLNSVERAGIKKLVKHLESSSFFADPASAKYHGAYKGGLAEHCLNVYKIMQIQFSNTEMMNMCTTVLVDMQNLLRAHDTIVIVTLLHDICKAGMYKQEPAWRKDENNKWQGYLKYVIADDPFPYGHGEKSADMIGRYIQLTDLEKLCIRWHMGAYNLTGTELSLYQKAVSYHPLVLVLNFCDTYESQIFNKKCGNDGGEKN